MELMVYEAGHFIVEVPGSPHVDRLDGGHLVIYPKAPLVDRTQLSPLQAIEMVKLTMVVGQAMTSALNRRGIDVVRINYQDNGNWGFHHPAGPKLHIHLYGRARSSRLQKHGEALHLPRDDDFYRDVQKLNEEDVAAIRAEIEALMKSEKYQDFGKR